ncbi:MAG: class I mannose-6-phosphate isomerase [Defluviitaleaceae bacterium]|nr:class I mannose-6-phosphate isomerase [Defluviitaleaceae bacterium]
MNLYPVIFHPIIKTMIWGQESWNISCRPLEMGVVKNGLYAGMEFDAYLGLNRVLTMGTRLANVTPFPLLVKIIHARDTLSVQVHPDDAYAAAQSSHDPGKNEMWYVLQPPTDGHLIIGLNEDTTREALRHALATNTVENHLHRLAVKAGDIVNIPAGLVHALTPGAIIAEIQQNSDTTYRMYDYNRLGADGKPRELHIEHAQSVTDCDRLIPVETTDAVDTDFFRVKKITLDAPRTIESNGEAFCILMCVDGAVSIRYGDGEVRLEARESTFVPAGLRCFEIVPDGFARVLHCIVPNKRTANNKLQNNMLRDK